MKKKQVCSHCGETISDTAKACWYCGSDEHTGWSEQVYMDGIDLKEDFDYDAALSREFGADKSFRAPGKRLPWHRAVPWTAVVGAVLLAAFILGSVQLFHC